MNKLPERVSDLVCAVVGVGAIGSVLASSLAQVGAQVSLVTRVGARQRSLQDVGLRVLVGDAPLQIHRLPLLEPHELGTQAVVFLAVKSQALPAALQAVLPLIGQDTLVVPLINGIPWWYSTGSGGASRHSRLCSVDPEGVLLRLTPRLRLVGSVVYLTAAIGGDGVVRTCSGGRLLLGSVTGSNDKDIHALVSLLQQAGLPAELSGEIRREVWTKVALNLATNPLSAVTGTTLRQISDSSDLSAVVEMVLGEAIGLASHDRICPSMTLPQMLETVRNAGPVETSMLQDLRAGRPLELGAIAEAVLELAAAAGLSMPVTRAVTALARYTAGRAKSFSPTQAV